MESWMYACEYLERKPVNASLLTALLMVSFGVAAHLSADTVKSTNTGSSAPSPRIFARRTTLC